MGIRDKIRQLKGVGYHNYLKGWYNWIVQQCKARGIDPSELGLTSPDEKAIIQVLLDYCDNLSDSECEKALIQAIREHGGVISTEEEQLKYSELEQEGLPPDIQEEIEEVIESMKESGKPIRVIYEVVKDILEDYEIPEASKWAAKLTGYEIKEIKPTPVSVATTEKQPEKTRIERLVSELFTALDKYVLVSRPTKYARPVSGAVEIGEVKGRRVYLVVDSKDRIKEIIIKRGDYAKVVVEKGYIEVY